MPDFRSQQVRFQFAQLTLEIADLLLHFRALNSQQVIKRPCGFLINLGGSVWLANLKPVIQFSSFLRS
jgi:hypothetical protein